MHDSRVLSACIASKEAYDRVQGYVDTSEFTPMAAFWWKLVEDWYTLDPTATGIDKELLESRGIRDVDPSHEDTIVGWFTALPECQSPLNAVNDLLEVKRYAKGNELAAAMHSNKDTRKLKKLVAEYDELLTASELGESKLQYAALGDELFSTMSSDSKLPLAPAILNERTAGGALPGDFIIVFGRKEMAKTLFCINMLCHWLRHGARVLYIGNEDKIDKIKLRVLTNLANMTIEQLYQYKDTALDRARKKGFEDRLFMIHLHPGTPSEIEELIVKHEPDAVIIDQIRNVAGYGDGLTQRMNQIAIDVRQIISKHQVIGVGVAQAYAGEHGKPQVWLDNSDIDSSRTGLPAQGDLIIGIGADEHMKLHNTRAISLPTNKLAGNHEGFTVKLDTQRNKVL